jgi:hypothetical protein
MIDAIFTKYPLEVLNAWNGKAKFSRAVLHKPQAGAEYTALEWNLDILGGVTEDGVRHFLRAFDNEVKLFDKFVGETGQIDKVFAGAPDAVVEEALKALKIDFKKNAKASVYYQYTRRGYSVTLTNFGKDLMISAQFGKATLEKINQWNVSRKFIRAVSFKQGEREYSVLETTLDCSGGVSLGIIQHFIRTFDDEITAFERHLGP